MSTLPPLLEKFLRTRPNDSFPITAVRNTAEWSFSKLRLIKTFHRSTVTDERQTNLAMISIESETAKTLHASKTLDMTEISVISNAKTLHMTEMTKSFAFLKTWKKSFS